MRTAAQTAILMAICTLISKILGFIREMVMANYFGTTYITDAYVMATVIPGIIFGGVLGAVSVAYMPIYSKTMALEGELKANEFTSGVLNILTILAVFLSILGIFLSDYIVVIFASGFKGETAFITSFFLRITFSYIVFSAIADIFEAHLRYKGVFLPQVVFGFIQNIVLIFTIIISSITSYYYLAFGYLVTYILRFIIMAKVARNKRFKYISSPKMLSSVKQIMTLAIPVFIGSSMTQINIFVDKTLASGLPEGSVSALNYGNMLVNMIMGLTITIMTTIIYPKLTQARAIGDNEKLSSIVNIGMILIIMVSFPFSLGAMVYSNQIVQIIYERGAFDLIATRMTSAAFYYYSLGLLFSSLNTFITQVYYSMHNMKTPVIFGAMGVIINVVLNLILIKPMGHSGLALATSIAAICSTVMFLVNLKKKHPDIYVFKSKSKLLKIILAAIIAIGLSYVFYLLVFNLIVARVVQLILVVVVAGLLYFLLLYLMKVDEINIIRQIVKWTA